jgi:hypothetical protein
VLSNERVGNRWHGNQRGILVQTQLTVSSARLYRDIFSRHLECVLERQCYADL